MEQVLNKILLKSVKNIEEVLFIDVSSAMGAKMNSVGERVMETSREDICKLDDEGWMGVRDEWNDRGCGTSRGEASTISALSHKSTNPTHKGSAS